MFDGNPIESVELRNRLMDIIRCANEEYKIEVANASEALPTSKGDLQDCEDSIRRRLYSVLLDALGAENESRAESDYFVKRVQSFIGPLGRLLGASRLNPEAKRIVANCLSTCIAAGAEEARLFSNH